MSDEVRDFVLEALRPERLAASSAELPRPAFLLEQSSWREALEHATAIHAGSLFARSVERASWYERVPFLSSLRLDECLKRERMSLAILDGELDVALDCLISARLPVMALKGADLARRFYVERLQRPMADVDLLVPFDSFHEALLVMGRAGFRVVGSLPEGRVRIELSRHGGGAIVELHRAPQAGDSREWLSAVWQRSLEGAISGLPRQVRAMAVEDLVSYLIRHAAVQHALESPIWLNDLHLVIQGAPGLDWERVASELLARRAAAAGFLVLSLLHADWSTPVPAEPRARLGRALGLARRRALMGRLEAARWFTDPRSTAWLSRARFLLRDSAWDAVRYAIARRPPPPA
jgi:hypothetical protein